MTEKEYKAVMYEIEVRQNYDILYEIMEQMKTGREIFIVDYPNYGDIEVKIEAIDMTNINWKPIRVKVLSDVQEEYQVLEESGGMFSREILVTKKRKATTLHMQLKWFKL